MSGATVVSDDRLTAGVCGCLCGQPTRIFPPAQPASVTCRLLGHDYTARGQAGVGLVCRFCAHVARSYAEATAVSAPDLRGRVA